MLYAAVVSFSYICCCFNILGFACACVWQPSLSMGAPSAPFKLQPTLWNDDCVNSAVFMLLSVSLPKMWGKKIKDNFS